MAIDRGRLARFVARNLQQLPVGANWSHAYREDGEDILTEGDYTDPIDAALRTLGYVDGLGMPDATLASEADFESLARLVEDEALERLRKFYATVVDTVGGPVRIYRSQIAAALAARGAAGSGRRVVWTRLGTRGAEAVLGD